METTTIHVTKAFPMRTGEVLRIKEADGKTPWRKYTVGQMLSSSESGSTFAATLEREA